MLGFGKIWGMRGFSDEQLSMVILCPSDMIGPKHPIRRIRLIVDEILVGLDGDFEAMYSKVGRPSIPPEQLLKAQILICLYSIRSQRQFCERLNYDMLFKWFLDMPFDAPAFSHSTFSKNCDRLLGESIAEKFFEAVVDQAKLKGYVSNDHFSVDGTLLEAWASTKSFVPKPKDGDDGDDGGSVDGLEESGGVNEKSEELKPKLLGRNCFVDFKGSKRSNSTHVSTTDPEARLFKKSGGAAAKLCFTGHSIVENRNGLIVKLALTQSTGTAERDTALVLLESLPKTRGVTVGADKGYDTKDFVDGCRRLGITAHVAQNDTNRKSAIDKRTTRHVGYQISLRKRKLVEEPFGWLKTIAGGKKLRHKGQKRNQQWLHIAGGICNLVKMAKLEASQ